LGYTGYYAAWQDSPSTATPVTAAALNHIDAGISATYGLAPSGDPTGTTDTSAIQAADSSGSLIRLAPGQWYIKAPALAASSQWLQGSGPATVLNVVSGQAGLTLSGPSKFWLSDLAFGIGSGSYGVTVNGASDFHAWNLYLSGPAAAGGITVNGDDPTEQHWSDIMLRNVGGTAFGYTRTTAADTGGMYLSRVRVVSPPASAAHGFAFTSTATGGTAVNGFLDQCVSDNYYGDAVYFSNVSNFRVSQQWAGLNAGAASGSAPLHVTGSNCYNLVFSECYLSQALPAGKCALIDGGAHEISIGGHTVFDGDAGAVALGLAGAGGNFRLGAHYRYVGTLTDTPSALAASAGTAMPVTFQTSGGGGSSNTVGIDDVQHAGNQVWVRNSNGALQFLNTGFSATTAQLTQSGQFIASQFQSALTGGGSISQGSGAPSKPNGVNPNAGDIYFRTDTPSTANQRIYICTTGGASPAWSGIV
jgi:hypothetical protein